MKFSTFNSGEDGEHDYFDFVEVSNVFGMQGDYLVEKIQFDTRCKCVTPVLHAVISCMSSLGNSISTTEIVS